MNGINKYCKKLEDKNKALSARVKLLEKELMRSVCPQCEKKLGWKKGTGRII